VAGYGIPSGWSALIRDPRFVGFVAHFNGDGDYFECHELMEELWLEEARHPLLQGLLQAAVGLHHWHNGNVAGAVKLMNQALRKLDGYPETALGLDLAELRSRMVESLHVLEEQGKSAPFAPFRLIVADGKLEEDAAARIAELSRLADQA